MGEIPTKIYLLDISNEGKYLSADKSLDLGERGCRNVCKLEYWAVEWKEGRIRGGGGDISLFPLCWLSQTCVRNTPAKEVRYDLRWNLQTVM